MVHRYSLILLSTTWQGEVRITRDTLVLPWATLTILPGTKVLFKQNPQKPGRTWTKYADDFITRHNDPTGTQEYQDAHFDITGRLIAVGTPQESIIFTSASADPDYADWSQLVLFSGSRLEYVEVSYAHNGVNIDGDGVTVRNSKIHDSLWSCIDIFSSNNVIEGNEVFHCWHQAIGVKAKKGNVIARNVVHDAQVGVNCEYGADPAIVQNRFEDAFITPECPEGQGNSIEEREPDTKGGTYQGKLIYPAHDN